MKTKPASARRDHSVPARADHTTGAGDRGSWSARRIAAYGLLTALTMALSFIEIPLFPAAPFLLYDPSGIVCLLAAFSYGPAAATTVSLLGYLPHFFINPIGALIDTIVTLGLVLPPAFAFRKRPTRTTALWSMAVGEVAAIALALLLNLVFTPLYAKMTIAQVAALILPALLPFNLLKFTCDAAVAFVCYPSVLRILSK